MKKVLRIGLPLVFVVCSVLLATGGVRAQSSIPHLTLSQVLAIAPADCSGAGCEGAKPPPLGPGCANNQPYETNQIDFGSVVFYLYLYGGNCGAFWAAAYYNCSSACNGQQLTITALGVWERNSNNDAHCDTSNQGALDSMPVTMSNSHHWESTYMIASDDGGCGGSAFHAAMYANDIPGGGQNLYNTDEWFQ